MECGESGNREWNVVGVGSRMKCGEGGNRRLNVVWVGIGGWNVVRLGTKDGMW